MDVPASLRLAHCWQIRDVFVLPTHRRLGVGRAILASVREAAIAAGALRLVLQTEDDNDPALRLYADSGTPRSKVIAHCCCRSALTRGKAKRIPETSSPLRGHSRTLAQATPWNRPGNDTLRIAQMNVSLRPLDDRDLDTIYQQVTDPESIRMAAFTAEDQADRRAFLNRMSRLRADTSVSHRVIDVDGAVAGTIGFFRIDDQPEVTYWVDRTQWGKGIASAALQILLAETAERPMYARAASDNVGSLRVLEKAGFRSVGVNRDFAPGRGEEIEETILRLD
jgi:RimJ/RimL family protein N-acetyltransferase